MRRFVALIGAAGVVLGLGPIESAAAAQPLLITFLNVGQGDAAIYHGPCGEIGIIDIPEGEASTVADRLDPFPNPDVVWVAASHYDTDHIGGIDDFLALQDVSAVYDRGGDRAAQDTDTYRSYHDVVTSVPGVRQSLDIGDTFALCTGADAVTFTVISAGSDGTAVGGVAVTNENDRGLCLKVEHGPFDMATCGDINGTDDGARTDVESPAAAGIGDVDFVKVNQHGSQFSSNQTWVNTLNPAGVLISVGPNSFGHPSSIVTQRWAAAGANVYRTDTPGPVSLSIDRFSSEFVVVKTGGPDFLAFDDPPDPPPPLPAARSIAPACTVPGGFEDGFADVPVSNTHEAAIDCIVYWQITNGLRPGVYDPSAGVTREQMATFIARFIEAADGVPLPAGDFDAFPDDNGSIHETNINRLRSAGLINGREDGTFGPRSPVTRAQMATFITRGMQYPFGGFDGEAPNYFTDDDGSVHEVEINLAARLGITGGTGDRHYGPSLPVRRDQMASFIARGLAELIDRGFTEIPAPPPKCSLNPSIERTDAGCPQTP